MGHQQVLKLQKAIAWLVMFLMPIPIFLSPSSSIVFANGTIGNEALAFPLSLAMVPLIFTLSVLNINKIRGVKAFLYFWLLLFSLWVLGSAFASASNYPVSLLYALQWILIFLWAGYFFSSLEDFSFESLARPFFIGAFFGAFYIFISGFMEFLFYGALLDAGRMTQNLVLKGQYQLAVYTPTVLAYSFLVLLVSWSSRTFPFSSLAFLLYAVVALVALIFTGAREGLLVYFLGGFFILFLRSLRALFVCTILSIFFVFIFLSRLEEVVYWFSVSELRLLNKIARLFEEGGALGARDIMIMEYVRIIIDNPFWGVMMVPPEVISNGAATSVKSAHNFYVDVWAWAGFPGFLTYLFFSISLLFMAIVSIAKSWLARSEDRVVVGASWVVIVMLLVSNNINVPLRQPLVIPLFLFCVYLMFPSRNRVGCGAVLNVERHNFLIRES